jgi:hypothetical protein
MLLLPGTEVEARGSRWLVVSAQQSGQQTLYRLRGLEAVLGHGFGPPSPFEIITPTTDIDPTQAARVRPRPTPRYAR